MITLGENTKKALGALEDNISILRGMSGEYAADGQEDLACSHDQAATLLEGALLLINAAGKRI